MNPSDRSLVARELVVALANVGLWTMFIGSLDAVPDWAVVALSALVTGTLFAVSDRSRRGLWLLVAAGALAIGGVLLIAIVDFGGMAPFAASMLGMSLGVGLNRVLFGLVRPVPEVRRRRERSA